MTLSLDFLVKVNIIINTALIQVPTFNNCMIVGLFPSVNIPISWGGNIYKGYTNLAAISADFTPLITGTTTQDNRYQWLINAATEFFSQQPTPTILYLTQLDPTTTNFVTAFATITAAFNNFYAFYIADKLTATQMTQANGVYAALTSLTSANNLKVLFVDTDDLGITTGDFLYDVTNGGVGNPRVWLAAHTNNFTPLAGGTATPTCLAAAAMGAYFTNLFTTQVGLKSIGNQQLISTKVDTAITATTLGVPGAATPNGILGVNGNVYPAFGTAPIGLIQYGFMASSNASALLYLDQIVGADWIKLNVQADLVTLIINSQNTGGLGYGDAGIQRLLKQFKTTLQRGVGFNIIKQFSNENVTAIPYAQVPAQDKTNRIYQGLAGNLNYGGFIQTLTVNASLGL